MLRNWFGIVYYSSMKLLNRKVWQSKGLNEKAWCTQQWMVAHKPVWRVCRHSGVGLATGERKAAQVRGILQIALQIRLVCIAAGFLPFCHPLLDPHKACRRGSASWCSAAAAQKHLSQPSVVNVKQVLREGHWQKGSARMWCRWRTTWGNIKHHWAWF